MKSSTLRKYHPTVSLINSFPIYLILCNSSILPFNSLVKFSALIFTILSLPTIFSAPSFPLSFVPSSYIPFPLSLLLFHLSPVSSPHLFLPSPSSLSPPFSSPPSPFPSPFSSPTFFQTLTVPPSLSPFVFLPVLPYSLPLLPSLLFCFLPSYLSFPLPFLPFLCPPLPLMFFSFPLFFMYKTEGRYDIPSSTIVEPLIFTPSSFNFSYYPILPSLLCCFSFCFFAFPSLLDDNLHLFLFPLHSPFLRPSLDDICIIIWERKN